MTIICTYHTRCDLPQKSTSSVKVNRVEICYDVWNKATDEQRVLLQQVTNIYNRGLLTKKDFSSLLQNICYQQIDPTFPVHI